VDICALSTARNRRSKPIFGNIFRLWKYPIPPEFEDRQWDFSRFSRGERFVNKPITREEFAEVLESVGRWGLDDYLKERSFDNLIYK
jgi:hypothetical protein